MYRQRQNFTVFEVFAFLIDSRVSQPLNLPAKNYQKFLDLYRIYVVVNHSLVLNHLTGNVDYRIMPNRINY